MVTNNGLLTLEEAIKALRLDRVKKHPKASLYYLVRSRQIGFTRVAGSLMFKPEHIEEYIRNHTHEAIGAELYD